MDNCVSSTKKILQLLKVEYTDEYVEDSILSHPDHPSLLSISDTLNRYKIENLAAKVDIDDFDKIPFPCLVQVSVRNDTLFYVLKDVTDREMVYFDEKNKLSRDSRENFLKYWTGVCLLAERGEESKEIDIEKKRVSRRIFNVLKIFIILSFLGWAFMSLTKIQDINNHSFFSVIGVYLFLKLAGIIVTAMLLWYEVDKYNPTLRNFCSGGKKINCDSVLNSGYAKLLGGNLNLSIVGFSYFSGSFMCLLFQNFSPGSIGFVSILSILAFPVVLISTYYQGVVIRQWCKFCITVQAVLTFELMLVLIGNLYENPADLGSLPIFFTVALGTIVMWKYIKQLVEKGAETNLYKRRLGKIKNNPSVFNGLIIKSRKLKTLPEGLGISINKNGAKHHIIKVCNPYCSPCARVHPVLEELVNTGKINLQMLFTASTDERDPRGQPVKHFLAIDAQKDKSIMQQALDDWYTADKKDYELFAEKYPMNGELKEQNSKIERMRQWCDMENITHTPTIFINGYELPGEYDVKDLSEILV